MLFFKISTKSKINFFSKTFSALEQIQKTYIFFIFNDWLFLCSENDVIGPAPPMGTKHLCCAFFTTSFLPLSFFTSRLFLGYSLVLPRPFVTLPRFATSFYHSPKVFHASLSRPCFATSLYHFPKVCHESLSRLDAISFHSALCHTSFFCYTSLSLQVVFEKKIES